MDKESELDRSVREHKESQEKRYKDDEDFRVALNAYAGETFKPLTRAMAQILKEFIGSETIDIVEMRGQATDQGKRAFKVSGRSARGIFVDLHLTFSPLKKIDGDIGYDLAADCYSSLSQEERSEVARIKNDRLAEATGNPFIDAADLRQVVTNQAIGLIDRYRE